MIGKVFNLVVKLVLENQPFLTMIIFSTALANLQLHNTHSPLGPIMASISPFSALPVTSQRIRLSCMSTHTPSKLSVGKGSAILWQPSREDSYCGGVCGYFAQQNAILTFRLSFRGEFPWFRLSGAILVPVAYAYLMQSSYILYPLRALGKLGFKRPVPR